MPFPKPKPPRVTLGGNPGVDSSYDQLYARCRVTLRPALAGRLGSMHDADDVLHDAFVRLLQTYARDAIRNPLAMLARIALNIVRDTGRSNAARQAALALQVEPVCTIPQQPDPETDLADRQQLDHLRDAIDSLPPRCREVFLLHRIEGLPQREVARLLGISRSGVEKHLMRANGQLRVHLAHLSPAAIDSAADERA